VKVLIDVSRKKDITDNKLFVKRKICHINKSLNRKLGWYQDHRTRGGRYKSKANNHINKLGEKVGPVELDGYGIGIRLSLPKSIATGFIFWR